MIRPLRLATIWHRWAAAASATEMERLRTALHQTQRERDRLQAELASVQHGQERLAIQSERYRRRIFDLGDKLGEVRSQRMAERSQSRQDEQRAAESLLRSETRAADYVAQIGQLEAAVAEFRRLKPSYRELTRERDLLGKQLARSQRHAQRQIEHANADLLAVQRALADRDRRIATWAPLERKLRDGVMRLERELSAERATRKTAEQERDRLTLELASSTEAVGSRDRQLAEVRVAQESLQSKVEWLGAALAEERSQKAQLSGEIDRLHDVESTHARLLLAHATLTSAHADAQLELDQARRAARLEQDKMHAVRALDRPLEWMSALEGILDASATLVTFDRATVSVLDVADTTLRVRVARNSPVPCDQMMSFPAGAGIAGWALERREAVLVADSRNDSHFKSSKHADAPLSLLAMPVIPEAGDAAVITLVRSVDSAFGAEELELLAGLRHDAEHLLANAWLVDDLKNRAEVRADLIDAMERMLAASDSQDLVSVILETACKIGEGTAALLALQHPKTLVLDIAGFRGLPDVLRSSPIAWGAPVAREVVRSGEPWITPMRDVLWPAHAQAAEEAGTQLLISVPVGTAVPNLKTADGVLLQQRTDADAMDEVSGVLNVYRPTSNGLPPGRLEQLVSFAGHAATALNAVHRWERLRDQSARDLRSASSLAVHLLGRERFVEHLQTKIRQLEDSLS
jgi:hypothetical protein